MNEEKAQANEELEQPSAIEVVAYMKQKVRETQENKQQLPDELNLEVFSEHSQEILKHFGIDAPSLLNTYSTAVEDALIEQVYRTKDYKQTAASLWNEVLELRAFKQQTLELLGLVKPEPEDATPSSKE